MPFDTLTEYETLPETTVEVPEITPVVDARASPLGSAGETVKEITSLPWTELTVGDNPEDIATPLVNIKLVAVYVNEIWFTVNVKVTEVDPPVFVPMMVTDFATWTAVGYPVIAPEAELSKVPSGSDPSETA